MTIKYAQIGVTSEGTLRTEDLLEAFANELRALIRKNKGHRGLDLPGKRSLLKKVDGFLERENDDSDAWQDAADAWFQDLMDALESFAPPYAYFGTLEGDGACFGFWPEYEYAVQDGELPTFEEVPDDFRGDCLIVSDHGNVTCGHVGPKGEFTEYWSVV